MSNSVIAGTGSYVPSKVVSNDDLSKMMDTNDEWIFSRTGIKNRHISEGENTSELAYRAGKKAIEDAEINAEDLDLIIVSTITPDMQMPSTACIVQKKLGAVNASAFDITAACSGFEYALTIADAFIKSGKSKNVLVIGAEVLSKFVNWSDRSTAVLFGDGAGAAVLKADTERKGIILTVSKAEGDKGEYLEMGKRPVLSPFIENDSTNTNYNNDRYLLMNGRQVLKFSTRVIVDIINEVLDKSGLKMEDIKCVVPHQANYRIVKYAAEKLGVNMDKFYMNIREYGNTSGASVPIALNEALKEKKIEKGDKIILVGFGGGLTYGAVLLEV